MYRAVRRLYRSRKNRIFAGVCGGIAEYFNIDPTWVRLLFVLLLLLLGSTILLYLLMWIIVPIKPDGMDGVIYDQEEDDNHT